MPTQLHGKSRGNVVGASAGHVMGASSTRASSTRWLVTSLVAVGVLVMVAAPFAGRDVGQRTSFVPALLALVGCLDLLSAMLMVRQFHAVGDRRALVLAAAYVFSLVVLVGYAAAFPGVVAVVGPLGRWPSTAPWLWVAWHTGFPLLLAAAVVPWPRTWDAVAAPASRRSLAWVTLLGTLLTGGLVVMLAVTGRSWLPVLIIGTDTSGMTRTVGPVMVPVVTVAATIAVTGGFRLAGPVRWASVATVACLADVLLTLFSYRRYSLGWYAGRGLTIVAAAVVLVALLAEFSRLEAQVAAESERLRLLLTRTLELEAVHSTLLDHMPDGVMLHDGRGGVVAKNPAAATLLGVDAGQLDLGAALPAGWAVLGADGRGQPVVDTGSLVRLLTSDRAPDEVVGVLDPSGGQRWLRITNVEERTAGPGRVGLVVSSMTDATDAHNARRHEARDVDCKRQRIQSVLDAGGPDIALQPIVNLRTGVVVGNEALARFRGSPHQGPDRWFADAAQVGSGLELELAAVRGALVTLQRTPVLTYLAINVSPLVAVSPELTALLEDPAVASSRVVLELTEHTVVEDYRRLSAAMAHLRVLGVRIAIDDTGSGFAGLSHILNVRPDIVKLDIELVRGIDVDPARRALASGLLTFACEIGASLVAEGIENEGQLTTLRDVGVLLGQGYHLGRPAPMTACDPPPAPAVGRETSPSSPARAVRTGGVGLSRQGRADA